MSDLPKTPVSMEDVARDIYFRSELAIKELEDICRNCKDAINALSSAKFATKSQELRHDLQGWKLKHEAFGQAAIRIRDVISPFSGFFKEPSLDGGGK